MPNKIDTDSIVRDRQDKMKDSADHSNAEYVTNLEKTSSLMPPEKPFETEKAQNQTNIKEGTDPTVINKFVQHVKGSTNDIEKIDKNNETKLHLLQMEYEKVAGKLGGGGNSKMDEANLNSVLDDVQDKIDLYKSKLKAGTMTSGGVELEVEMAEDGDGEGTGEAILEGAKDQILMAAPGILVGKKDEEEEKEEEEQEKEFDQ